MAATAATLKALLPEFASLADAQVTAWLGVALRQINADFYGSKADDATHFLAAHLMTISNSSNPAPNPTNFPWAPQVVDANLSRTAYGQMFLQIRNQVSVGAGAVIWQDP